MAQHILSDERKHMDPTSFESLMILKVNHRFWNVQLVADALT